MAKRQNISSGQKWEEIVAYSRAVVVGNQVFISGTTATNENGEIVGIDNPYLQAKQALINIKSALKKAGADINHVVRTRMFVTNISQWKEYAKAHKEVFDRINPVTTMVEVSRLINPDMLIEIEVDALIV